MNPTYIFILLPLVCAAVGWVGSYYYYDWRVKDLKNSCHHFKRQRDIYADRLGLTRVDECGRPGLPHTPLSRMRSVDRETPSTRMDEVSREGDR